MVESLEQARHKMKVMIKELKQDTELFEEALDKIHNGTFNHHSEGIKENMYKSSYNMDKKKIENKGLPQVNQNVRVKLPQEED